MCLRSDPSARPLARLLLALALVAGGARASAAPDDTLDYLEARGLDALAALRLESLAEGATGDLRNGYLERLADLYARLLDERAGTDGEGARH